MRAADEIRFRKETNGDAGAGSARTPGALNGGGLTDLFDTEAGESTPRRVSQDAGEAGIDDGFNAVDGDGTFGDVGGTDDLACGAGRYGLVLLFGSEIAVQR